MLIEIRRRISKPLPTKDDNVVLIGDRPPILRFRLCLWCYYHYKYCQLDQFIEKLNIFFTNRCVNLLCDFPAEEIFGVNTTFARFLRFSKVRKCFVFKDLLNISLL